MRQAVSSVGIRTPTVAVVIPCLNEASSIASVVDGFRTALPDARIVVVDNASSDGTGDIARAAGAEVIRESRAGKGVALLTGLKHAAPSEIFVMVDGDGTYPCDAVTELLARVLDGADMVIGTRLRDADARALPAGHTLGNRLFIAIVRLLFGIRTLDLFSGYRALTSRVLEECPLIAQGFEIEAELSLQAFMKRYRVDEVPVKYCARPGESRSKLRTFRDGGRVLVAILTFFRDYRPLTCFGALSALLLLSSVGVGSVVIQQYVATGQVLRVPLAICAAGLFILSALSMTAGVLLSSINRRAEELRSLVVSRWT